MTPPKKHNALFALPKSRTQGPPSIKHRGLVINGEQPALSNGVKSNYSGFYDNVQDMQGGTDLGIDEWSKHLTAAINCPFLINTINHLLPSNCAEVPLLATSSSDGLRYSTEKATAQQNPVYTDDHPF